MGVKVCGVEDSRWGLGVGVGGEEGSIKNCRRAKRKDVN